MFEFSDFVEYFFWSYGIEIITLTLASIFGCLGYAAKKIYKNHINDETKRNIAKAVVQFVEQVYKDVHGEEKLFAALERAAELLAEKGIKFSAVEMETLIEAAVAEFNEAFHKKEITEGSTE